jgi:hypothetical protein
MPKTERAEGIWAWWFADAAMRWWTVGWRMLSVRFKHMSA